MIKFIINLVNLIRSVFNFEEAKWMKDLEQSVDNLDKAKTRDEKIQALNDLLKSISSL